MEKLRIYVQIKGGRIIWEYDSCHIPVEGMRFRANMSSATKYRVVEVINEMEINPDKHRGNQPADVLSAITVFVEEMK